MLIGRSTIRTASPLPESTRHSDAIDRDVAYLKTNKRLPRYKNGPREPATFGGDKGVAAFAKAYNRSEPEVRALYDELTRLVRHERGFIANRSELIAAITAYHLPRAGEILTLCALPGSASEIWSTYKYAHWALTHALPKQRQDNHDVMDLLCSATGLPDTRDVDRHFDGPAFDERGALLPDRTDNRISLFLAIPAATLADFKQAIGGHDAILDVRRLGYGAVSHDAHLYVSPTIDRPALMAALEGAQVGAGFKEWDWLRAGTR